MIIKIYLFYHYRHKYLLFPRYYLLATTGNIVTHVKQSSTPTKDFAPRMPKHPANMLKKNKTLKDILPQTKI